MTVKGGGITRILSNNDYTGVTTIDGSRMSLGGTSASSGFVLVNNGTLQLRDANLTSSAQNITGTGSVTKDSAVWADSTISGNNNNYTGITDVNISKFTLANGGVISGTSGIRVRNEWAANLDNLGTIITAGAVTINGFTNTSNVNSDVAKSGIFRNGNAAGTSTGLLTAASITLESSFRTDANFAHGGEFFNYPTSTVNLGSGAITVAGQGNSGTGGMVAAGGTFTNAGSVIAGTITLNSSSTANTVANKGGSYTQTSGTTTLSGNLTLAANGGSGAAGTPGNDSAFNLSGGTFAASSIAVNSGTLTANGGNLNPGAGGITSTGANAVQVNLGATTLVATVAWSSSVAMNLTDTVTGSTFNTTGGNIGLSGGLSGSGKLVKSGTGTLTLTGTNNYSGATTVNGGTLGGTGSVASPLIVNSPGTLAPGTGIGTFHAQSATFNSGSTFAAQINSTTATADNLTVTGAVDLGGATLNLSDIGTGTIPGLTVLTLIDYSGGSLTGTFAGINEGDSIMVGANTFKISYVNSSKVTLTVPVATGYESWALQITNGKNLRTDDADGDGFTNLQEFLFGTDPNSGTSQLATTEISGGNLIIRWKQRTSGATYTLKESSTLANPWADSAAPVSDDGSPAGDYQPRKAEVTIGSGKLFFRVEGVENN